ncbi:MAG: hypothetical protein AABZ39_07480 [Spirochaetota bacterium]
MNTDSLKKIGIPIAIVLGLLAVLMVVLIIREFRGKKEVSMADDIVTQAEENPAAANASPTNDITFLYSTPASNAVIPRASIIDEPEATNAGIDEDIPRKTPRMKEPPIGKKMSLAEEPIETVKPIAATHASIKKKPASRPAAPVRTVRGSKPVITDIIIDYNKQRTASPAQPLLVTFAAAMPSTARYADIRIFARRVKGTSIVSRDLIHEMHKIYSISGKTQTQFYWTGKTTTGKTLAHGTYILYAECEAYTAGCTRVGAAGRYALPKWSWKITLR